MALTERNLSSEFDDLKADMKSMIDHISRLTERLGEGASDTAASVPAKLRSAAAATGALGERALEFAKQGEAGLGAFGGYIRQYPVTSVVVAFGLGLVMAKLLDR